MPVNLDSVGQSLFEDGRRSYLTLTVNHLYRDLFQRPPKHALSIPADWADTWLNDYHVAADDFASRPLSLAIAASANRRVLDNHLNVDDDGIPLEWTLVFQVSGWQTSSHLHFNRNGSQLCIDTKLTLVRPTAAEIRQYAGVESEVAHA